MKYNLENFPGGIFDHDINGNFKVVIWKEGFIKQEQFKQGKAKAKMEISEVKEDMKEYWYWKGYQDRGKGILGK